MDVNLIVSIVMSFLPVAVDLIKENSIKYQAHLIKVKKQAGILANEALSKKSKIPNEFIIQEPKDSIIFPTLQTCIPYLGEESIRKLFANLLASAYDARKINNLHPGFVNLITQLSPNDVRILSYINNHKDFIGLICIKDNQEYPLIDSEITFDLGIEQVALSIFNLKRLGILTVDSYLLLDKYPLFSKPINSPLQNIDKSIKDYAIENGYELYANDTFLTELGKSFLKVCIE